MKDTIKKVADALAGKKEPVQQVPPQQVPPPPRPSDAEIERRKRGIVTPGVRG